MTEKEARKIIEKVKGFSTDVKSFFAGKAHGYLEAVDRTNDLMEAVDGILLQCDALVYGRGNTPRDMAIRKLKKSRSEFEKVK